MGRALGLGPREVDRLTLSELLALMRDRMAENGTPPPPGPEHIARARRGVAIQWLRSRT